MINTDIVFLDLNLKTKKEIIDFLIKKLKEHNYLNSSSKDFKNKILIRENEVTTYMGNSIAIPHAKSSDVKKPFITFLRLKKPLEWNGDTKSLVNMIFMLGVPNKKSDIHLKVLSNLAKKLINKEILNALAKTTSESEVIKILDEKG